MAKEPGKGLSLLKTLSDNPNLESHYERVFPPEDYKDSEEYKSLKPSHGWSVLNYKDIFMAKPNRHTDQVTIATKFGVGDQWKVYADKQTKLNSDERDEICDRYHALLYLCTCQGRCDVDLDFIEGRHRLVNVLYFMNAAKYDSNLNDIIPSTANVISMFKYGVGDEPDKLRGREVCASSSNRNFKGRQGSPSGRTLLMSPAMVAAAAIAGEVVDVRKVG